MLLFTCEGPRSIDERDVIYVYRAETMGRYCSATIVLADGRELSGLALVAALDASTGEARAAANRRMSGRRSKQRKLAPGFGVGFVRRQGDCLL